MTTGKSHRSWRHIPDTVAIIILQMFKNVFYRHSFAGQFTIKSSCLSLLTGSSHPSYLILPKGSKQRGNVGVIIYRFSFLGLYDVQFGNNWMKNISRTAKIRRGLMPYAESNLAVGGIF